MKTAVETFTTSEGTGGYNNKPLNQFKITMKTAVEWLQEQYNQCPKYEEQIYEQDWEQAKEMEKEREKSIFSIAYRMTPIEFGKEYCDAEFEKFNKTFKQQEQ
jgi:hypothetical protein